MFRVVLSALALTSSFFAIARLPFAVFTAISFTRPVIMMVLAMIVLREVVPQRRWAAAALAIIGVFLAVNPGSFAYSWGVPAAIAMVLFGTSAIVLTRQLGSTPLVVMMTFYTAGLALLTAPFAMTVWTPIASAHLFPLMAIGLCAQAAQFCFLHAHARAEAGFLSVLGYLSLVMTSVVGYVFFNEEPTLMFFVGSVLIVVSAVWTSVTR